MNSFQFGDGTIAVSELEERCISESNQWDRSGQVSNLFEVITKLPQ
jgi:hypothetical protein